MSIPLPLGHLSASAAVSSFYRCYAVIVYWGDPPKVGGNREIPAYFFVYAPPKTTFSLCASGDLSASCVGSASQAITMQRADTAKQINFLASIDSFHQTFGLAPPPQLFGYLSASAAVSSFYRCYAVIVYWGDPPKVGGNREIPAYFFVYAPPKILSTCLRSKPLLARGQRAL